MSAHVALFALVLALLFAGVAGAQFPMLDMAANKVVQKYAAGDLRAAVGAAGQAEDRSRSRSSSSCCAAIPRCAPPSSTRSRRPSPTRCSTAA